MVALFFSEDISYVVSELKKRKKTREFLQIDYVPDAGYIYRFLSRFTENQFFQMVFGYLNSLCKKRSSQETLIIDSTDVQVDLNWFRKNIKKKDLEDKDYAWAFSSSKGYYIGCKATLVVEYPHLRPVYFCMHRGSPNDAKMLSEILEELRRRRILRNGDTILTDKGYTSYKNYSTVFSVYKAIPLIMPRKNMSITRILSSCYPLEVFSDESQTKDAKQFFRNLYEKFKKKFLEWEDFRPLRGEIEDVFKLVKNGFIEEKIHRYTGKSCYKFVILGVLLAGTMLNKRFCSKEHLQTLSEW
jgi:hypothetical protein